MTKISVGRRAPNVMLSDSAGRPVKLSNAWDDGRHALIIFLRHLA